MEQQLLTFLLMFSRISAYFIMLPLFSYRTIPVQYKVGLSIFLTLVIMPTIQVEEIAFTSTYILLVLKEVSIGLMLSFVSYVLFATVQVGGAILDFQIGFAFANVVDPQTGVQSPIFGRFFNILLLFLFIATDAHHIVLTALYYSFEYISVYSLTNFLENTNVALYFIKLFSMMFLVSVQIVLPFIVILLLTDVTLGILTRAVPQLNIFAVGLPIKILVLFVVLFIFMRSVIFLFNQVFGYTQEQLMQLLQLLGGS